MRFTDRRRIETIFDTILHFLLDFEVYTKPEVKQTGWVLCTQSTNKKVQR